MNDTFVQGPRGLCRKGGSPWGICMPSDHKKTLFWGIQGVFSATDRLARVESRDALLAHVLKNRLSERRHEAPIPPARLHFPPQAYGMR